MYNYIEIDFGSGNSFQKAFVGEPVERIDVVELGLHDHRGHDCGPVGCGGSRSIGTWWSRLPECPHHLSRAPRRDPRDGIVTSNGFQSRRPPTP